MEGLNDKIESRLSEVKVEFEKLDQEKIQLNEQRSGHVNQVSAIDRRINEINVSQVGLNARYTELIDLLPEDKRAKYLPPKQQEKQTPKKTTVKKRQ